MFLPFTNLLMCTTLHQLQRIGRTGRKREGYVHVLLSEDREERNWDKADDNYKDVQRFIIKDEQLELYDDVERLIPEHIKPECVEMMMDIEEYVREEKEKALSKADRAKAKRAKSDDDVMRNIPSGASTTFVSVRDLLQKGSGAKGTSRKRKKGTGEFDEKAGEDDSDDMEITAGVSASLRRALSMPSTASSKVQAKKKMRRTVTTAAESSGGKSQGRGAAKKKVPRKEFEEAGVDDSDDEAIRGGLFASFKLGPSTSKNGSKTQQKGKKTSSTSSKSRTPSRSPQPTTSKDRTSSFDLPPSSPEPPLFEQPIVEVSETEDEDEDRVHVAKTSTPNSKDVADVSVIDLTTPAQPVGSPEFRWSSPDPIAEIELPSGE